MPAKPSIIADPLTNRGTAFTEEERRRLGLIGRFPSAVETLDQQATRTYAQLTAQLTNLDKYVFLDQLHNRNEVLYYRVLADHLSELLPIVYDPTVGEAIKKWSRDYRRSRAVYLSVDRIEDVRPSLEGLCLGPDDVDLLVVSDAEEILGIGDWGVNGTGAIVIAAVVSGMKVAGQGFADQRLVVYGAGTADGHGHGRPDPRRHGPRRSQPRRGALPHLAHRPGGPRHRRHGGPARLPAGLRTAGLRGGGLDPRARPNRPARDGASGSSHDPHRDLHGPRGLHP